MRITVLLLWLGLAGCSLNNVEERRQLAAHFPDGVEGCFGLFDNGTGRFTVFNLDWFRDSAFAPAETFHIVQALAGLESGLLRDSVAALTGMSNRTLQEAFAGGDGAWFDSLYARQGWSGLRPWLDTLGYGAADSSRAGLDSLPSLRQNLRITPDEQLGFCKKLYFGQLPFQPRTQRIVRHLMLREQNANYSLSYAFGGHFAEGGLRNGWVMGWIEENRHPYFFVLQTRAAAAPSDPLVRDIAVLRDILRTLGFFEGRK